MKHNGMTAHRLDGRKPDKCGKVQEIQTYGSRIRANSKELQRHSPRDVLTAAAVSPCI